MNGDVLPVFGDVLPLHLASNQTSASNQTASNHTSASVDLDVIQTDDVTMIAFVAFTSVCILATIVGNILVVLSIFTYRPLRGVQNYYIVSLACADLAVAVFVMPFNVADSLAGHWQFGAVFCNMWLTFDILMCTASILNLCAIAGDRFFAIHDPINYAQKRTLRRVMAVIAIVWTASAIISIPPLFGWNNSSSNSSSLYDDVNRKCQLTDEPGFVLYSASGSFYIPLVIMAFLYAKIYRATRQRLRKRSSTCVQPRSERRRKGNSQAAADSPNPEAGVPASNHNGSIQLGKVCHDRGTEQADRRPDNKAEAPEEQREAGNKGLQDKNGTGQGLTPRDERRASTSRSDTKESLKRDGGGTVTSDSARRPLCDTRFKRACDSNNKGRDTIPAKSTEETPDNNFIGNDNARNNRSVNGTLRDGNLHVGDGNKPADDGKGTLFDVKNKTEEGGTQQGVETPERRGTDAASVTGVQPRSNGDATSKRTRSRTKNSLKISSSMPRRVSKPMLTVSILNAANRAQSENWAKTETRLSLKPHRWSSQSPSPDLVTRGSSRLSQILENRQKISLSKERRAARTMAVIMGAFVLCWLPFFLMYVTFPFCESCRRTTDRRVKNFIVWLGYVNSALNPVIYTIFNIDFRRAFKSLLQGNCRIIA